ncbi:putative SAM and SH3 domain-containing protein 1-like isoform [Sesbania bispinosa]|nr:putative SAM and SH3 domain-containing protein 1-like isoform [Sesbania bispinosa]
MWVGLCASVHRAMAFYGSHGSNCREGGVTWLEKDLVSSPCDNDVRLDDGEDATTV